MLLPRPFACLPLLLMLARPMCSAVAEQAPAQPGPEQLRGRVARLLSELDDARFAVRQRAAAEIERLVASPSLATPLAAEFQRELTSPDLSFEVRWHLRRWSERLPKVPPARAAELKPDEVARLVQQLDDNSYAARTGAAERLKWLLTHEEHLPRVKEALEARRGEPLEPETKTLVEKLWEMTRPALVAEFWQGGRCLSQQHLLVGVPSMAPGALRPSHFDRIDDKVAHCVSGTNLSPGDYPVGVAFPHPHQEDAAFRLVNLPTPGRRAAYARALQSDNAARLTELSRQTLERVLQEKHRLSERELVMLAQLDIKEISRFAGQYFLAVDDGPLPMGSTSPLAEDRAQPSRFGVLCLQLAVKGTHEAAPGLLEAIAKERFLAPTAATPYRLQWLAALSIAARDPWPEADAWLAGLLARGDRLVEDGRPDPPELAATAAGVLLRRHQCAPATFGLQQAADPLLTRIGVDGFRFPTAATRAKVRQWWDAQANARP